MKKAVSFMMVLMTAVSLAACGNREATEESNTQVSEAVESSESEEPAETEAISETPEPEVMEEETSGTETGEDTADAESATGQENILIAYFSMPEDISIDGIDADAGASVVVKDGEKLGNVQYIAQIVQDTVGGDLFRIETVQQYPLDHDPLVDQAAEEQDADARPELSTHIENLDQYDTIILGFPNWWGDMPQPLYTFLEEYDFSGKTIIPFCPHGGSGFSQTESTIAALQPGATVSSDGYTVSRNNVVNSEADVIAWANSLGPGE